MEIWVLLIPLVVGFGFGYLCSVLTRRKTSENFVGTLRVDRSDPNEAPYLFLELDRGGMSKIYQNKIALFKVDLNSYLTRN